MPRVPVAIAIDANGRKGLFSFHIMRRIESLDVNVRLLVGASAGAIVAALFATGRLQTTEARDMYYEIDELVTRVLQSDRRSPTRPVVDSPQKSRMLFRLFRDMRFGDVRVPLVVLAATEDGRPVVFQSWNEEHKDLLLYKLVDASSALPGFFPMVNIGGRDLIDGGVVSCQPIGLAYVYAASVCKSILETMRFIRVGGDHVSPVPAPAGHRRVGITHFLVNGLFRNMTVPGCDLGLNPIVLDILGDRFLPLVYPREDVDALFASEETILAFIDDLLQRVQEPLARICNEQ